MLNLDFRIAMFCDSKDIFVNAIYDEIIQNMEYCCLNFINIRRKSEVKGNKEKERQSERKRKREKKVS